MLLLGSSALRFPPRLPESYVVGFLHGVILPCLQSLSVPGQTDSWLTEMEGREKKEKNGVGDKNPPPSEQHPGLKSSGLVVLPVLV